MKKSLPLMIDFHLILIPAILWGLAFRRVYPFQNMGDMSDVAPVRSLALILINGSGVLYLLSFLIVQTILFHKRRQNIGMKIMGLK